MLPKEIQILIDHLSPENKLLFRTVISYFESKLEEKDQKIAQLEAKIKKIEDQQSQTSKNSSKPPSTDEFNKPAPKSRREKTGRSSGGQKGHKGSTLKMSKHPDKIERHKVQQCEHCHTSLTTAAVIAIKKRQVYDVPPIQFEVTEHQAEVKQCKCGCINVGTFPAGVDRYVQYGPRFKATMAYLQNYQLLPFQRTQQLVQDLLGHQVSTGTLSNISQSAHEKLEDFEEQLKRALSYCQVVGFDETGFRILGQRMWLHNCSTSQLAFYAVHHKRGKEATDEIDILPHFSGIAVHDFWKTYFRYVCTHALCGAHLDRELTFIQERFNQNWAGELRTLLFKMNRAKDKALAKSKSGLSVASLNRYRKKYEQLIEKGLKANPFEPPPEKKKGRDKKSKPRNLVERLRDYKEEYLRFLYDFEVPFDNNAAERDLRMMKVKQKISGCFRSLSGAQAFARIRSYIVTARKQHVNCFLALINLFGDQSIVKRLVPSHLLC